MRRNTRSDEWWDELYTKHGIHRLHHWKKGNQRNTFIRSHAELAVEDTRLVEAFSKDCTTCQVTTLLCEPADWTVQSPRAERLPHAVFNTKPRGCVLHT